jgi:cytoskeleton protein RodZ
VVGEILRKRREELGRDLREIANDLKIRYDYLQAIEEEDLGKIPAEVYIKGYIQEYAKALHMDPKILMDTYVQQKTPSQAESSETARQDVVPVKKFRAGYLLIALVLIVSAIIVMSIISPGHKKNPASPVSKPTVAANPTPAAAVAAKKDVVSTPQNSEFVLKIHATGTTWILAVIDKTDTREVLMKPGESVTWHAKKGFSLKIGNAGGVRLEFNGKEIGKLGEEGQVVKINLPEDKA